jgi:hypothetical protein
MPPLLLQQGFAVSAFTGVGRYLAADAVILTSLRENAKVMAPPSMQSGHEHARIAGRRSCPRGLDSSQCLPCVYCSLSRVSLL